LSYSIFVGNQNLIIYKFNLLYQVLQELDLNFKFKIFFVESEDILNDLVKNNKNYLILSDRKYSNRMNQLVINSIPIKIFTLLEKINIQFLKQQFNNQSELKINHYTIDLNSRSMLIGNKRLKLTEKEINTILYLSKSNTSISVNELQEKVWNYQSNMETHTVETHIYRLRKKIFKAFNDGEFIINKKNGYQIK
jgi:hypothetical protein